MTVQNLYEILGVPRDADDTALKKAYKKQAITYHPDKQSGTSAEKASAEDKFKDVAKAFEVLSNPNQRAIYDRYGEEGLQAAQNGTPPATGSSPGPGGMRFSSNVQAAKMFESMFGGKGHGGLESLFTGMGGSMSDSMGGMGGMGMFAGVKRRRDSCTPAPGTLPPGSHVKLVNLSNATYNGSVGSIEAFDAVKERYHVSLRGRESSLAVPVANVRQIVSNALITGTSKPELNGRVAAAATFDSDCRRYKLEGLTADGSLLALKPENVCLPRNVQVIILGVQSRPALNGRKGQILDVENERYVVSVSGETLVSLRFGNVVAS